MREEERMGGGKSGGVEQEGTGQLRALPYRQGQPPGLAERTQRQRKPGVPEMWKIYGDRQACLLGLHAWRGDRRRGGDAGRTWTKGDSG